MADLPGPEKPIDWGALLGTEMSKATAARPLYSPGRVRPRHRIAVMLHESGWKSGDIAKCLGYTEARVSVILNSHNPGLQRLRVEFASQVADQVQDVHSRLKLYANEMLTRLVTHARQIERPELSRLAARDILHMAGFSPVKKVFAIEARLPVEDLKKLVSNIEEANEVVLNSAQWRVKNPGEEAA
jgi:predicted transcriptional regulator